MSLTSGMRPSGLPFASSPQALSNSNRGTTDSVPFYLDADYLALTRMLTRYQNLILLTPSPAAAPTDGLTPWQTKIQAELWSSVPYHRTKWLRNIEGARTLLLQLERTAQGIKVQRTKRDAIKDLADKRNLIKKLRSRIEEIGREVEAGDENVFTVNIQDGRGKETLYDYLKQVQQDKQTDAVQQQTLESNKTDEDVKVGSFTENEPGNDRDKLLNSASNVRRRQGKNHEKEESTDANKAKTSGFTNLFSLEESLQASSKEHDDIAQSLVSMAAQLKQQARQFQFTLDQDKGLLDRALEGLDQNVSAMGIASKGINSLTRMSEEQGYFGRLKLYAIIFGMWIIAILLVFVGPKLRF